MGSRYDFVSPGAAFVNEMTKVLAERKAEQRQQMLDNLAREQEARAAQEMLNAERHREHSRKQQDRDQQLQELGIIAGNMSQGDDPTSRGVDPAQIELGTKLGFWTQSAPPPTPSVSTEITSMEAEGVPTDGPLPEAEKSPVAPPPPAPAKLSFVGTAAEREKQRKKLEQGNLLVGLMSSQDPKEREVGDFLRRVASLNDGEIPPQMLARLLPDQHVQIFDEEAGTIRQGPKVSPDAPMVTQRRPPRDPVARMPVVIGTQNGNPVFRHPDGSTSVDDSVQLDGKDPEQGPLGIPVGLLNSHREAALGAAAEDAAPNDIMVFKMSAQSVISAAKQTTQQVRQLVSLYVENPLRYKAIVESGQLQLTSQEIAQLAELRRVVPDELVPVLIQHAPKPKKTSQAAPAGPGGGEPKAGSLMTGLMRR